MTYLPWGNWKEVAVTFLNSVIARNTPLSEVNALWVVALCVHNDDPNSLMISGGAS